MASGKGHIPDGLNLELVSTAILGAVLRLGYYYFVVKKDTLKNIDLEGLKRYLVKMIESSMSMYNEAKSITRKS